MEWLLEDPTVALFVIVVAVGMAVAGWMQTGETRWLFAGLGLLAVGATMLAVELFVETDRERITAALSRMASACERQNIEALQAEIDDRDPQAIALRNLSEAALADYRISRVKISDLKIRFNPVVVPHEATAEFMTTVHGAMRSGRVAEASGLTRLKFELRFRQTGPDGQWKCIGAERSPIQDLLGG